MQVDDLAVADAGVDVALSDAVDAAVGDRAVAEWDAGALAADAPVAADLDALVAKLADFASAGGPNGAAVIVDNTSSEAVADRYGEWLAAGVHVVTPNKKANSGDLERFRRFRAVADESGARWLYEGTIGAGLPVVSTLRTLRASGDRVRSVQGIFSGTMSFLFNTWDVGAVYFQGHDFTSQNLTIDSNLFHGLPLPAASKKAGD